MARYGSGVSIPRGTTLAGRLASLGFADADRAERLIAGELALDIKGADGALVEALAAAADPDAALAGLARLAPDAGLLAALRAEPGLRARLAAVLGASAALADHLARHPADWRELTGPRAVSRPEPGELRAWLLASVGADPAAAEPSADPARLSGQDPATSLRVAYRRGLLRLAARDLTGAVTLDQAAAELADLAAAALEAALAIARSQLPPGATPGRLAVIAMGKCGGRELNYASDVDVIFVGEPAGAQRPAGPDDAAALRTATRPAAGLIRVCSQAAPDGPLFPVDANLRPEGRAGPLVRTLASHRAYYERWAKTWEFQALLKARPVAGDPALGAAYAQAFTPLVWQAAQRDNFVEDTRAMRRRVISSLPAGAAGRQLKLGPGGLRDIEFAVQLLQLVHGRVDESLREPSTLPALAMLAAGGYVGRRDAAELAEAYRFLRRVEHLLQLRNLRRTHTMPEDPAALRMIGRALRLAGAGQAAAAPGGGAPGPDQGGDRQARDGRRGRTGGAAARPDPAEELLAQWREHAGQAQRLHEKLFYRPLLDAVASLPGEAARLTPEAAEARLEALGYADPAGALRHIGALTAGMTRRAAIQRTLLPLLLGWFADAADPDAGLLAFHQVSDALGNSPWYLRLLRDDMTVAQRMARLLASSRYAAGLLLSQPETVAWLGNDAQLTPRDRAALHAEATALVGRHAEAADAVVAVRALRCRELLRTAMADLLGRSGPEQTGEALTAVATVTIEAALQVALRTVAGRRGDFPTRLCVV